MRAAWLALALVLVPCAGSAQTALSAPTIDQMVALKRVQGATALSPDGRLVAYVVREANWEDDAFETEIFVAETQTGESRQLTNARKSSDAPAWSPDGAWLAFASDRGGKRQVYLISPSGGEAEALTSAEEGVTSFAWSRDGTRIAYVASEPKGASQKERDERYGEFEIVDSDHRMAHLHVIEIKTRAARRVTQGAFFVSGIAWSPDGKRIAFERKINNDAANSGSADIWVVEVESGEARAVVAQAGPDVRPVWSPDGTRIAFDSAMEEPFYFYKNSRIAVVPAAGGQVEVLTPAFDEDAQLIAWGPTALYFSASQKTETSLFSLDPGTKTIRRLPRASEPIASGFSFSRDFTRVAFVASSARAYPEVYSAPLASMAGRRASSLSTQLADFRLGTSEVISWKSTDGAAIEGVLRKPSDWKPGERRPLLIVIHGGPTGISRPSLFASTSVYPIDGWLERGALVLEPNYRGSAGYGEAFRSLNVRNLGVGDAWDVTSGIDHLVAQGLVDAERVGVMGWSQGGYISAFLTTHDSARFKAVSVGAGISDWMTYYVNTDIHPFTRQYLKATPWDDPEIYAKTSPITYVKGAKAPTLIQHGEKDARVPLPNAYELYQGLQDQRVPVRLIVYKGFGHGLNKPKAVRAALEHNLEWFGEHFWGDRKKDAPAGQ